VTPSLPLTAGAAAAACHGRLLGGGAATPLSTFSSDTRALRAGETFIALVGPRFDGNDFAGEAAARGARAVVVSRAEAALAARWPDLVVILVDDTLAALQALARHVRRVSAARVVAITGSTGKTTTKDATASLLSTRFRTVRSRGNLNNEIGLPLSLLGLQAGDEVAVVELGMNRAGEISKLVAIAEPDVRVWTNVGTAHLAAFGSMDAIAAAKAEVLEGADAHTVFVANADDPRVMARAAGFPGRTMTFGIERDADVRATKVRDRGLDGQEAELVTPAGSLPIALRLPGRGHLANVLAAVAVALHFGLTPGEIARGVLELSPAPHRGEVLTLANGIRVFDDCYNSSPGALAGSLEIVAATAAHGRKIAVLGEMLELGPQSEDLHRELGRRAAQAGLAALVTVGGAPARALGEAAQAAGLAPGAVVHAADSEDAAGRVRALLGAGDLVLVKGSRGIGLERVVERLKAELA
jgi:UDP-N-acetylmuramoyl-tripeptide--D-alanyl-D-alanine ligase